MQKSTQTGIYFDKLVTTQIMSQICFELTGHTEYEYEFVENNYKDEFLDATYNQGRLAILQYKNTATYISFSDEKCEGRNSGIQSVPTAFNRFFLNSYQNKNLFFYFLPCTGNNATSYYLFMYRLMKTAGFNFLNCPESLVGRITPFTSIDDIIRARAENGERNSGNNATYIVKNAPHEYEIYGKTYGANKYDTSLICYAISKLALREDRITLYEYNERDLKENNSLRSPRFNAHLLDRLGERHCVLCNCRLSEIIQGAHIWPVSDIKKTTLSLAEKLAHATDGENGLWMCQNHHKMFDSNIILLSATGKVTYKSNLSDMDKNYIQSITTVSTLSENLITPNFELYINKRYSIT